MLYCQQGKADRGEEPREFYEAVNHKYALSYVIDHVEEELSEDLIKHIGIQINKNIKEISGYRTEQVFIRGDMVLSQQGADT